MDDCTMDLLFTSDDGSFAVYDTTGDGMADTITGVTELDGHYASLTVLDTDSNGVFDTFVSEIDNNDDGFTDMLVIMHDYDQDGTIDSSKTLVDTNNSGDFDTVVSLHHDNTDSEYAFRYEIDIDLDGDHVSDFHYEDFLTDDQVADMGLEQSYDFSLPSLSLGSATPYGTFDTETPPELVAGDPASDMDVWEFQGPTNRCALFSQKFVIEQLTDETDIDIEEFANIAKENGWFTEENGTGFLNMNKMLDYYGVDNEMVYDADISDLEEALRNGDKVIVSVDSGQIWYNNPNDIFSPSTSSDHALQVAGIDYSNPDEPMVILNDSGSPMGCGEMVSLETFENAWGAGDHQMIVCHA